MGGSDLEILQQPRGFGVEEARDGGFGFQRQRPVQVGHGGGVEHPFHCPRGQDGQRGQLARHVQRLACQRVICHHAPGDAQIVKLHRAVALAEEQHLARLVEAHQIGQQRRDRPGDEEVERNLGEEAITPSQTYNCKFFTFEQFA